MSDAAPYAKGDRVKFLCDGKLATVRQCWNAVGGWRVLAQVDDEHHTPHKGMRDFMATGVELAPNVTCDNHRNPPMKTEQITVDLGKALQQLQSDPSLADKITQIVAPMIPDLMKNDALLITQLQTEVAQLHQRLKELTEDRDRLINKCNHLTEQVERDLDRVRWDANPRPL
ncbi:hypothetical protein KEU06_09500 [Pseudaminobacter sp. 19-2017]|uniref:Uncharacterized protein n=1 Tax=Pseudaminobacter soli (ex Zhang et al. 2022) TaxID=2831468 RepID=A0A942E1F7_9HYPH|nr:hypothetical protein [Pseudaminobacter soli]MBS3648840.1 hypothetical protein [Pseudaminobacter soli]